MASTVRAQDPTPAPKPESVQANVERRLTALEDHAYGVGIRPAAPAPSTDEE